YVPIPTELATRPGRSRGADSVDVSSSTQHGNGKHMTQTLKTGAVDLDTITSAEQLPENYLSEEVLKIFRFTIHLAFLRIDGTVDTAVPAIDLVGSIGGHTIGRVRLDPRNPRAKFGG